MVVDECVLFSQEVTNCNSRWGEGKQVYRGQEPEAVPEQFIHGWGLGRWNAIQVLDLGEVWCARLLWTVPRYSLGEITPYWVAEMILAGAWCQV